MTNGTRVRRAAASVAVAVGVGLAFLVPAAPAGAAPAGRADTPSTLTVVGTSDVSDSGLVANLIKPMFQAAYPGITLNYVPKGTSAAIAYAEAGTASALIVHAASVENQFVANGYSNEAYGRAVFYGDYVLLGPASDPAHVLGNASTNIVQAFEDIAAAGAAGTARFVSRNDGSGTNIQEHDIWGLTSGTTTCPVSAANGGGAEPSTTTTCGSTASFPSWYIPTGDTQGPNVEAANTCTFNGSAAADCYVLTDRGTFDCLMNAACRGTTSSANSGAPSNLDVVTSDNAATSPGGSDLLINSFHAYAVNPQKFAGNPNVQLNTVGAEDFLNFLTSPSFQAALKGFLAPQSPFVADASPVITASRLPSTVSATKRLTVTGSVTNAVPGTPALAGTKVTVSEVVSGLPAGIPVASTTTNASGRYTLRFRLPSTGRYQITTPQITKVENAALQPVFADVLQAGATTPVRVRVRSAFTRVGARSGAGAVLVNGSVAPGSGHAKGRIYLSGRDGSTGSFHRLASATLASGAGNFGVRVALAPGSWQLKVRFADPGRVIGSTSRTLRAVVSAPTGTSVGIGRTEVRKGRLRLAGTVTPGAAAGSRVELLGLDTAAGAAGRFRVLATRTPGGGATGVKLRAKLARGARWLLVLAYVPAGSGPVTFGRVTSVAVG